MRKWKPLLLICLFVVGCDSGSFAEDVKEVGGGETKEQVNVLEATTWASRTDGPPGYVSTVFGRCSVSEPDRITSYSLAILNSEVERIQSNPEMVEWQDSVEVSVDQPLSITLECESSSGSVATHSLELSGSPPEILVSSLPQIYLIEDQPTEFRIPRFVSGATSFNVQSAYGFQAKNYTLNEAGDISFSLSSPRDFNGSFQLQMEVTNVFGSAERTYRLYVEPQPDLNLTFKKMGPSDSEITRVQFLHGTTVLVDTLVIGSEIPHNFGSHTIPISTNSFRVQSADGSSFAYSRTFKVGSSTDVNLFLALIDASGCIRALGHNDSHDELYRRCRTIMNELLFNSEDRIYKEYQIKTQIQVLVSNAVLGRRFSSEWVDYFRSTLTDLFDGSGYAPLLTPVIQEALMPDSVNFQGWIPVHRSSDVLLIYPSALTVPHLSSNDPRRNPYWNTIGVPEDDSETVKKKVMEMVLLNVFHLSDSPHFESLEFDEQVDIITGVVAQIRSLDGTKYRLPANSTPWQVLGTPER